MKGGYSIIEDKILPYHKIKGKVMEKLIDELKEFNYYKQLILHGEAGKRNVLIEKKDGTHYIAHQTIKAQPKRRCYTNNIPGFSTTIDQVERITVFVDGKEYEFVACQ